VVPDANGSALNPWIWPLPAFGSTNPIALGNGREHVELGYALGAKLPTRVPVFAAHDGVCVYAGGCGDGFAVCIDHPGGWSTQYGGLDHMSFAHVDRFRGRRKECVRVGDVIGYAQSPPRLRFTLATLTAADEGLSPVDPSVQMKRWLVLPLETRSNTAVRVARG
jgi:murein DD-endopeptidase MepM/ murein hydrolase activator NlpD